MFAKLKQQMSGFLRDMEQRDELVENLNKLLQSDTNRLLDIEYTRIESYALANGISNVAESYYGYALGTIGVGDYIKEFSRYTDDTLHLLSDTFSEDPDGFNQLMRDAGPQSRRSQAFLHERLMFPLDMPVTRRGTSGIYRDSRSALGVADMSKLPPEQHAGVVAVLQATLASAKRYTEERTTGMTEMSDNNTHMTSALAALIMSFPDRTDDILQYMDENSLEAAEVDAGHLHDVLNAPTYSLRDGVL